MAYIITPGTHKILCPQQQCEQAGGECRTVKAIDAAEKGACPNDTPTGNPKHVTCSEVQGAKLLFIINSNDLKKVQECQNIPGAFFSTSGNTRACCK